MSPRPSLALVLALVAVALPAALADDGKPKRPHPIPRGPSVEQILRAADRDGDGRVSRDEFFQEAYEKFLKTGAAKNNKRLDKDGDGQVSLAEFLDGPAGNVPKDRFKKYDKDGSGFLERAELEGLSADMGREARKRLPEFLARYDDDYDGKVQRSEFPGSDAVFQRLDRNGDGVITAEDALPG
ncbi:MAG TPA: EF-hand domain-containing protein, partial [Planctomycetota bacterium]|nr:EF-hand domain-containing protein [Planctomycetota bacterium]